ncbi:MAG: hypothetical protein Ct9H300mP20_02860 [Gammaproteobacteria bacterium]|nr:MAG: hypothetical protein Ct9H300mP20_02860 [Gammaproteobacteria bacterium]
MNLEQTDRVKDLIVQVSKFMDDHIWPEKKSMPRKWIPFEKREIHGGSTRN